MDDNGVGMYRMSSGLIWYSAVYEKCRTKNALHPY